MSRNSSFNNDHLHHLYLSSNNASINMTDNCLFKTEGVIILITFLVTYSVLLLPISFIVIFLGLKRRFQQCFAVEPATVVHSDVFIYHMAAMEFVGVSGCLLMIPSIFQKQYVQIFKAYGMWSFSWYGETFFYLLTCMEHYLAVVHPVAYRNLRNESGIRIRNITIVSVWLLNLVKVILHFLGIASSLAEFYIMIFLVITLCFSLLSIISVLIGPIICQKGKKRRLNRSKKKAFYQIFVIQTVLLTRCAFFLSIALFFNGNVNLDCLSLFTAVWTNLGCSVILPLLFLQRTGMLACCNSNTRKP